MPCDHFQFISPKHLEPVSRITQFRLDAVVAHPSGIERAGPRNEAFIGFGQEVRAIWQQYFDGLFAVIICPDLVRVLRRDAHTEQVSDAHCLRSLLRQPGQYITFRLDLDRREEARTDRRKINANPALLQHKLMDNARIRE